MQIADWTERFRRFEARKDAEARRAVLYPFVTDVDVAEGMRAIGNTWSRSLFDGAFYLSDPTGGLPSTSLVFVQSREGNTAARNPSTLGGGETDRHVIYEGLSRVAADAVLAGAGTIGRSQLVLSTWHPEMVALRASLGLPRHPTQIVASIRGLALTDTLLFNVPEIAVVLLTTASAIEVMREALDARPWIRWVTLESAADLRRGFRALRGMGVRTISCIGGRTLAAQLIDAGLVRDVYLTTSAKSGGEPDTPLYPRPLPGTAVVRKQGTAADAGVVFEHLALGGTRR